MSEALRRHKYAFGRILIPAGRILSTEFSEAYVYLTGPHVELLRNLLDYANRQSTFVDAYYDGYYLSPDDTDWDSILAIVAELELMLMGTVIGYYDAYVCVRDKKAVTVDGGSFTQGAWRTRDINDEHADIKGIASIASNQITLAAGTYRCVIVSSAYRVNRNQLRLYNVSDTASLLVGQSHYQNASVAVAGLSMLFGRFTLADTKVLEVQHNCETTKTGDGFGVSANFGDEIYTTAEFWREV